MPAMKEQKKTEQLNKCEFCAYKVGDRVMVNYEGIFYPGVLKALPHEDRFNRYKVVCDGDDESTTYTLSHKIKRQTSIEDENTVRKRHYMRLNQLRAKLRELREEARECIGDW